MLHTRSLSLSKGHKAFGTARTPAGKHHAVRVACLAAKEETSRRDVVLGGAAMLGAPFIMTRPAGAAEKIMEVSALGTFQKAAQRQEFLDRATTALRETLTAADAPACMTLLLNDAATYDPATKTGGVDGSVILNSAEANSPENAALKPLAARLAKAKQVIDAGKAEGQADISWADLIVLAAKVAVLQGWREIKIGRAQTVSGGKLIADAYGAEWKVRLGRVDNPQGAGLAAKAPGPDASTAEVKAFLKQLGAKPDAGSGPFSPKPPFWVKPLFVLWPTTQPDLAAAEAKLAGDDPDAFAKYKAEYERSRGTLTRTDYEVDFINAFTRLADLANFQTDAYLHPEKTLALKF